MLEPFDNILELPCSHREAKIGTKASVLTDLLKILCWDTYFKAILD
jgi:hypothetical protein